MLVSARAVDASSPFEMPKSSTLGTRPCAPSARKMFCGFRSRWMIPAPWAATTRRADGKHDVDQLVRVHASAAREPCAEIFAGQELHDQVAAAALGSHVGDVDGVQVTDLRRELGLAQEPGRARLPSPPRTGDSTLTATRLPISMWIAS